MKNNNNNLDLGNSRKLVQKADNDILVYSTKSVTADQIRENGTVVYQTTVRTGEDNSIIVKEFLEVDCKVYEIPGIDKNKTIDIFQRQIKDKLTDFRNKLRTSIKTLQDLTEIAEDTGKKFKTTTSPSTGSIFQTKEAMEVFLKSGYEEETVKELLAVIFNG